MAKQSVFAQNAMWDSMGRTAAARATKNAWLVVTKTVELALVAWTDFAVIHARTTAQLAGSYARPATKDAANAPVVPRGPMT